MKYIRLCMDTKHTLCLIVHTIWGSVIFSYVYYKFPECMCVAFIQFKSMQANWHVLEEFPEIFCVTFWSRFHLVCCRERFSPGATQTSMFQNMNYWSQSIKFLHKRTIFLPQPLRRAPCWTWPLRSGHQFTKETFIDSAHNYIMQHATYELNKWNGSHSDNFCHHQTLYLETLESL